MLLDVDESQLVLVDYQARLMPVIDDAASVLDNARRLARSAERLAVPVWGTEQNPSRLGPNDETLRARCRRTFGKMQFGGAAEGLAKALRTDAAQRNQIVIAGCETHVCLLQTALQLLDDGFEIWVVSDACGSRTERNRDAGFDRLVGAGATLVTTEMVAFEWLRSCEHPAFRDVLALIK